MTIGSLCHCSEHSTCSSPGGSRCGGGGGGGRSILPVTSVMAQQFKTDSVESSVAIHSAAAQFHNLAVPSLYK